MKKIFISILLLLFSGTNVFAQDDVTIDSTGNITSGTSATGNLEVTGSEEDGIVSTTSGTGKAGVYGGHSGGNYGILGDDQSGVYGNSSTGWAGYFEGAVNITTDLTVVGTIINSGLDAAYVNEGQAGSITSLMILDGTIAPDDVGFNYAGSLSKGGPATDLACAACVSQSELDFTVGTGDITGVTAGTGLTGGGTSGDITLDVMVPLTIDGSSVGSIVSGINYSSGQGVHGESYSGIGGHFTSSTGYGLVVEHGNVGIGTLSPSIKLEVDYGNAFIQGTGSFDEEGEDAVLFLGDGLNFVSAVHSEGVRLGSGFGLISVNFWGNVGISNTNPPARLSVNSSTADGAGTYADGIVFTNDSYLPLSGAWTHAGIWSVGDALFKGDLVFGTDGDGLRNTTGITERMRIDSSGNVGIGTIPTEKLTVAGTIESTSGGIKFPDGSVQTSARYSEGRMAIVAEFGGDYTDPITAMNNAFSGDLWCRTLPRDRCLLKIMPGYYYIGDNSLQMMPEVDIEGSGEHITLITSNHSSDSRDGNSATVIGADNAEIRFLMIENRGGGDYAIGIYNYNSSPEISNVIVNVLVAGGSNNIGVMNDTFSSPIMTNVTVNAGWGYFDVAVRNFNASPKMINVKAYGDDYGVYNYASSPEMNNVTVIGYAGDGIYNNNTGQMTIRNSSIKGAPFSINNDNIIVTAAKAKVAGTMLDGLVSDTGFTCVGAYTEDFVALNSACK